jgi:predicted N-formylglutamate amidohydrolase
VKNQPASDIIINLVITCEHGGNEVPDEYRRLFEGFEDLLQSHRGWDPGAIDLAKFIAEEVGAPLFYSEITRLLVELNRSEHHRSLFSVITKGLSNEIREKILQTYYYPYRERVFWHIHRSVQQGPQVMHFSVHSFAPSMNGKIRNADAGILFDTARPSERRLAGVLAEAMRRQNIPLRVRKNYPYRGKSDGHTSWLRKKFDDAEYAGIELEINQDLLKPGSLDAEHLFRAVADALKETIKSTSRPCS